MDRPVKNLLLDIGNVMLFLRFEEPARRMMALCGDGRAADAAGFMRAFYGDPVILDYEHGRVDRAAFVGHFTRKLDFRGTVAQFEAIWRSIFVANPPMLAFAGEAARVCDVYYFSNTSELHVPHVYEAFPAMNVHKGHALSYELGAMKPAPEFFRRGLARLGLAPGECLFVDDLEENVAAAAACGIDAFVYTTAEATIARLRRRLPAPAKEDAIAAGAR